MTLMAFLTVATVVLLMLLHGVVRPLVATVKGFRSGGRWRFAWEVIDKEEHWILAGFKSALWVLLPVLVVRLFFIDFYSIPTVSMLPTFAQNKTYIVRKNVYGIHMPLSHVLMLEGHKPERGDVVVFRYPRHPETHMVKRVIGIPGDVVSYKNKVLSVNGIAEHTLVEKPLDKDLVAYHVRAANNFTYWVIKDSTVHAEDFEVIVPEGKYWMMGDNRDHSIDSRDWDLLPYEELIGKMDVPDDSDIVHRLANTLDVRS